MTSLRTREGLSTAVSAGVFISNCWEPSSKCSIDQPTVILVSLHTGMGGLCATERSG